MTEAALAFIRELEQTATHSSPIHSRSAVAKLLTTLAFILSVISVSPNRPTDLALFVLYPAITASLADLPIKKLARRILPVLPMLALAGLPNVFLDRTHGWASFFSLLIKGALTVSASVLLIATTGMRGIASALDAFGVPKALLSLLLLTWRYLMVLTEEAVTITRSYALRSPGSRGIKISHWGSLGGQWFLRTADRADKVQRAMSLRGFQGSFPGCQTRSKGRQVLMDLLYVLGWLGLFLAGRLFDVAHLAGTSVIKACHG